MQYMQVIDFHKYTATNRHKWTLLILAAIFNFKFKLGLLTGGIFKFSSVIWYEFDWNLLHSYCTLRLFWYIFFDFVYFHDSCLLPVQMFKLWCIFMIQVFTCTNVGTLMKAKAESAQFILFLHCYWFSPTIYIYIYCILHTATQTNTSYSKEKDGSSQAWETNHHSVPSYGLYFPFISYPTLP